MLCWEKSSTFCVQSIDIDPDHAAGYGMNMFQINDKRAMNGGKHALIQFLPYFIQIHVGLIFHFLCVDNRLTPPLFQIQDFVKLQTVPHPAVTK